MPELAAAAQLVREISPVFASHLLRQMAQLAPDRRESIDLCRDAAQLVGPCLDHRLRAEAWIHLGQICQAQAEKDRSLLVEAVRAYQQALRCGISLDCEADFFALAQNNIGLAYLAMPMTEAGDHLRTGVAIQSFREALKVYDKEKSPQLWVSTQLNLANALQYMKSSHPEENLARAVEIYEELLSMRKRAFDPIGYARLLANQANALAHLGVFAPAMEKANEAHKLFHWHNEPQLASAMLELASEINSRLDHSVQTGVR
jgi:tetratricopeptide (TPR) repeat protein